MRFQRVVDSVFKKLALITYNQASLVTSLFENNKALQVELGCPEAKIQIVSNGVAAEEYTDLENKHMLKRRRISYWCAYAGSSGI